MILNREVGGYARGDVIRLMGSFQTNGAGAVTIIRDGHSFCVLSVVFISTGIWEVTFDAGFPVPELLVKEMAGVSPIVGATVALFCGIQANSWNRVTRKFRINTTNSAAVLTNPDVGSRINFQLVGSITSPGTDLA